MLEGDLQLLSIPSRLTAISFFFLSRRSAGVGGNLTESLVKFPRSHDVMNFRRIVEGLWNGSVVQCVVELLGVMWNSLDVV